MSLRKSSSSRNGSKSDVLPNPNARRRCTPAPSSVGLERMRRLMGRMDMSRSPTGGVCLSFTCWLSRANPNSWFLFGVRLELCLELLGFFFRDALLDDARRVLDEILSRRQAKPGPFADDLDYVELVVSEFFKNYVVLL